MHDAEFGVVPRLRKLPLLETIEVVIESLLLYHLKRLELNKLSERVLVRLSLEQAAVFGVRRQSLVFFFKMQQSIGGVLRELQRPQESALNLSVVQGAHPCQVVVRLGKCCPEINILSRLE